MKTFLTAILLAAATMASSAQEVATNSFSLTPNILIPDFNGVGVVQQFNVTGVQGYITNVQITLDISGGFTGDLYAYLIGPNGQMAILLNRVGVTAGDPFGYSDPGFLITLDGAAGNNIHGYGAGYSVNGFGQVTGIWAADGRLISPYSAGSAFDSASTLANLNVFNLSEGAGINGLWTLFIADLAAGGGDANLHNVILTIITVPEPQTWALFVCAALLVTMKFASSRKSRKAAKN